MLVHVGKPVTARPRSIGLAMNMVLQLHELLKLRRMVALVRVCWIFWRQPRPVGKVSEQVTRRAPIVAPTKPEHQSPESPTKKPACSSKALRTLAKSMRLIVSIFIPSHGFRRSATSYCSHTLVNCEAT